MSVGGMVRGQEKSVSCVGKIDDGSSFGRCSRFYTVFDFLLQGAKCAPCHYGYPVDPGLHSVRWLAVYHGGTAAQKKFLDGDRLRRNFPVPDRLPSAQVSLPAHCLTENFCPALLQSRVIFRPS